MANSAPPSGYLRLERGSTAIVMDAGAPPDLDMAGSACAGSLSFEMSTGSDLLFVNAGRPIAPDAHARALARSTASHNTLCLNDQSSSTLIRNAKLEQAIGAVPIRHPDVVKCMVAQDEAGITVEASHDGYLPRFSLIHARKLQLDATGTRLDGVDTPQPRQGRAALRLGPAVRHPLPPASGGRGQHRPDTRHRRAGAGDRRALAAVGHGRRPVDRGQHLFRRHLGSARRPVRSRCARCAAAPPRSPGGSSASARAARWMPRRASASAQKSGKPRRMRCELPLDCFPPDIRANRLAQLPCEGACHDRCDDPARADLGVRQDGPRRVRPRARRARRRAAVDRRHRQGAAGGRPSRSRTSPSTPAFPR